MKKTVKYILPVSLALVMAVACEDHRSDYMEEFQTMLYFRNGGEQDITLFRTGEDDIYSIPVCKSGRNLEGTATCEVLRLDEAQMQMYNISKETNYTLIPENLIKFVDVKKDAAGNITGSTPASDQTKAVLKFGPSDASKVVYVSINTVRVSALQEADPDAVYVLGFQVFSPGTVSSGINVIVVKPSVDIPSVSFVNPGTEIHKYTSASPVTETYRNQITLNMEENRWPFTCTVSLMDQAWLDAYNNKNGTSYVLFPAANVTIPESPLSFAAGDTEMPFDVTVSREGIDMLTEYAIPITISACSKEEFSIDPEKSAFILNVRMDPDQITLTEAMIDLSDDFNVSNDGDGKAALVDDNFQTYWHSPYSSYVKTADPVYGIYFDITLNTPLRSIVLRYITRHNNSNGVPTHVVIGVSNDKAGWTVIGDFDDLMPEPATATWVDLPPMKHTEAFKYIRFGVAESVAGDLRTIYSSGSQPWTALGGIELFGTN